jgi:hypothetical protein
MPATLENDLQWNLEAKPAPMMPTVILFNVFHLEKSPENTGQLCTERYGPNSGM